MEADLHFRAEARHHPESEAENEYENGRASLGHGLFRPNLENRLPSHEWVGRNNCQRHRCANRGENDEAAGCCAADRFNVIRPGGRSNAVENAVANPEIGESHDRPQ